MEVSHFCKYEIIITICKQNLPKTIHVKKCIPSIDPNLKTFDILVGVEKFMKMLVFLNIYCMSNNCV